MRMRKIATFIIVLALLAAQSVFVLGEEESRIYFKSTGTDGTYADGGYYAKGADEALTQTGENGIEVSGTYRILWAFTNDTVESHPMLYFKLGDNSSGIKKITISKNWDTEPEIELTIADGENAVNLFELLSSQSTIGYSYVVVYIGSKDKNETGVIDYMYLSNVGTDGKIYEKPVQPLVPEGDPSKEIRYQLESFEADKVDENGYGFLMSADCAVKPEGKGFTLQRKEGSKAEAINIAWVVPYEQLETTPYLAFEVANEGRSDQGPRLVVFPYWESVVGSAAKFDLIPTYIGANSLNGTTKLPLRYAVDLVPENLHGEKGIAIIFALQINERTDGTSTEPLVINDVYLLGYKEGGESYVASETISGDDTSDAVSETSAESSSIPVAGKDNDKNPTLVYILIGAGVVVAAAVIAVVLIKKKKEA